MYGVDCEFWGPFHEVGEFLIEEKGISVVPVMPADKMPAAWNPYAAAILPMEDWTIYAKRLPTSEEYKQWSDTPDLNIGVPLGKFNRLVALDLDDHEELHEDIISMLDELSPLGKKAKRGKTYFFKYSGESTRIWHHPETRDTIVELLSDGRQTVIPPSWHPDGVSYEWLNPDCTLSSFDIEDLPELPRDFVQQMDEYVKLLTPTGVKPKVRKATKSEYDDIKAALDHIPSDDYWSWVRIGMALNDWSGSKGFDLWEDWSKGSNKYKDGECVKKWNSFTPGRGLGIGTVFHEARQHGFVITKEVEAHFELTPEFLKSFQPEDKPKFYLDPSIVNSTPGLVGRIQNWIVETAIMPQPELAMAAALTLVGTLKGQKSKTESGLRTNIYMLGVAPSGSGKNHPMEACEELLHAADLMKFFGGRPASDSGLLHMLERTPCRLVAWDEIGKAFASITGKKANPHQIQIITLLMELFSSANRTFIGKELAKKVNKNEEVKRVDIFNPCLNLLGMTTEGALMDNLTIEMLTDGFLSRLLIIQPSVPYPESNYKVISDTPKSLVDEIKNLYVSGHLDESGVQVAQVVPYSASAKELILKLKDEYEAKRNAEYEGNTGLEGLYVRSLEHIQKIALTVSIGETIQYEDVFWAAQLVKACTDNLFNQAHEVGGGEFGKVLDWADKWLLRRTKKNPVYLSVFRFELAKKQGLKGASDALNLLSDRGLMVNADGGSVANGCRVTHHSHVQKQPSSK